MFQSLPNVCHAEYTPLAQSMATVLALELRANPYTHRSVRVCQGKFGEEILLGFRRVLTFCNLRKLLIQLRRSLQNGIRDL